MNDLPNIAINRPYRSRQFNFSVFTVFKGTDKALDMHLIMDNLCDTQESQCEEAAKKKPSCFHMHFIFASASWLNLVEKFFCNIKVGRTRRGVFKSIMQLKKAIMDYLFFHRNTNLRTYQRTATPEKILAETNKAKQMLEMLH